MDEQEQKPAQHSDGAEPPATVTFPHDAVAALAYAYWQARGCPDGSRDEDWFRAEQEMKARKGSQS